jgi:predicted metalloprotease with PDZ domain
VCACSLDAIFTAQVRGASPIDPSPTLARLGLRALVDTALAADSTGAPLPDTRVSIDFTREGPPLALVLRDTASTWRTSGLRTGDLLVALGDTSVASAADFFRALRGLRVGDTAVVNVRRESHPLRVRVPITSYQRPRVRFIERPDATAAQRARRARWLAGW